MPTTMPTLSEVAAAPRVDSPSHADSLDLSQTEDGPRRRAQRQVTVDDGAAASTTAASRPTSPLFSPAKPSRSSTRRSSRGLDPNASALQRVTTQLFTPPRPLAKAPGYVQSVKALLFNSWVNILLVFIPIGWALHFVHAAGNTKISDTAIFCTTFISIIPLAGMLGFVTEEAAIRLGQTLGGLLNATLGNVVELIVAILALVKCELAVVQSSLVGSILSNILLVLGMCFFAGGVRFAEQSMKSTAAQLNSSLLLISVIAFLVPSAFHFSFDKTPKEVSDEEAKGLLGMSHGVSILLLLLYIGYLLFQMWSHANLYDDDAEDAVPSTAYRPEIKRHVKTIMHFGKKSDTEAVSEGSGAVTEEEEEEEEVPQMNLPMVFISMCIIGGLVGVTAEWLVDSIDGLTRAHPSLSKEWVGLILLPIVGNAAEHFTAVSVAVKDKLDLSISVAVGSSIQIALFVIPVIQLLAWTIGKPLTMLYDPFESLILFFSVLVVNQTLADGRSNWMEGLVLMFFYIIIAVAFWFYPGSNTATLLGCATVE